METLAQAPGLVLALIGWAATTMLLCDARSLRLWSKAALIVFTWMLWMIPAFDIVVHHGIMAADMAIAFCGMMTATLAFVVSLTVFYQWRKHKQ